jgi:hypothetical protein
MALTTQTVQQLDTEAKNDFKGIPLGKILCLAKAAWKAYQCETTGGTNCIQNLVKDIEACLK